MLCPDEFAAMPVSAYWVRFLGKREAARRIDKRKTYEYGNRRNSEISIFLGRYPRNWRSRFRIALELSRQAKGKAARWTDGVARK